MPQARKHHYVINILKHQDTPISSQLAVTLLNPRIVIAAAMSTILLVGATRGLGESLANTYKSDPNNHVLATARAADPPPSSKLCRLLHCITRFSCTFFLMLVTDAFVLQPKILPTFLESTSLLQMRGRSCSIFFTRSLFLTSTL
jgi:hypothetical protein